MPDGSVFPAFLRLEYQPNGSAKSSFLAEMASISGDAKRQFERSFGEISNVIKNSLSGFKGGQFSIDLDTSSLRQAASEADYAAQQLAMLRDAARSLAAANGDTSAQTQRYLQALSAQTIEAERAARAAQEQVTTYSRLQGEIDRTIGKNTALADSYRATFAEQAKAANYATAFQQAINQRFAPRLNDFGAPKSARDSASVFETQQFKVSNADTRSGLDRLLAGQASIDKAALSGTTLEQVLGRVANKGKDVAAALREAEQASRGVVSQQERLLQVQEAIDAALSKSRNTSGSLDLGVADIQQSAAALEARAVAAREVANAMQIAAREEGDYSAATLATIAAAKRLADQEEKAAAAAREHAIVAERVQEVLNRQASATDLVVAANRRGTSETSNVINGIRAQRVAFTQLGQQLQDVVVQTQMGTNATTIFVQQVPQMAFALSGLAENTNKTYAKIGQFAAFLAGPWGAVFFAATAVIGPLIANLIDFGDESDKAKDHTYDFSKSLDIMTLSVERGSEAMKQLADATRGAIAVQGDFLANEAAIAKASVSSLQAEIEKEQQQLATLKSNRFSIFPTDGESTVTREYKIGALQANIPNLQKSLASAQQAQVNAEIATSQRKVNDSLDAATAATNAYNEAVGRLNERRRKSVEDPIGAQTSGAYIDETQYQAEFRRLTVRKNAAIDAAREAKKKPKADHTAEKAAREAERLANFGDKAAESIQRINERFDEQPRLVDQAAQATRQLDDIIKDLEKRKPSGFEQMIADAEKAKGVIEEALVRPFEDLARDSQRRLQVQDLLSQGREAEASAVQEIWRLEQQLGPLTAERLVDVRDIAQAEQDHIEKLRVAQEIQSAYLDATRGVRSEVEAILGGYGKLSNLRNVFQQLQGRILAEKLFGDVFRDLDKWVKEKTGIGSSVDAMAKQANRAGDVLGKFADAVNEATKKIDGNSETATIGDVSVTTGGSPWSQAKFGVPTLLARPNSGTATNDNGEIVVVANKSGKSTVNDMTPERYFELLATRLTKPIVDALEKIVGPGLAKSLGGPIAGALEGYLTTGTGFGAVLGGLKDLKALPEGLRKGLGKAFEGAQTGAKIAGIGNALGLGLSNTGAQIGGAIGNLLPIPGGDLIGSIAGGFLGKLFGKRPRGGGSVTQDSVSVHANDNGITDALNSFGGDLQGAISKIASTLGGQVGSYNVGIGRYKDYYQVSDVGNDPRLGNSYFGRDSKSAVYDGKDEKAAMRAAILNALQDGAIKGIREGTKRLLASGKDLDAQLQKALDFENVFKDLKRYTDPVGAALDEVNSKFGKLKTTFAEAGASAAETADLEKLYGIERAKAIKDANEQVIGSLNDLLKSLTINNSNRSLQEREAEAFKAYKPLEDRVNAGDTTAFSDYAQASRDLLDIQRQLYGSQAEYFASENNIKSITENAINKSQQVSDAATNRDNPFKSTTGAANDNASVTSAITDQTNQLAGLLGAANTNLGQLIRQNRDLAATLTKLYANGGYAAARGNF